MHQRRKRVAPPTGPALKGEKVAEFWVWIWSAIDAHQEEAHRHERDEAMRLAVAFDRAVDLRRDAHDFPFERFVRDQNALSTALLAHYLIARSEQWLAALQNVERNEEARARLRVIDPASQLFDRLLGVSPRDLSASFERLEVGTSQRSVFRPQTREGIVIESLEEGPALHGEHDRRSAEALTRWRTELEAARNRPKKLRSLVEVLP